jgi:hypothetical protein
MAPSIPIATHLLDELVKARQEVNALRHKLDLAIAERNVYASALKPLAHLSAGRPPLAKELEASKRARALVDPSPAHH